MFVGNEGPGKANDSSFYGESVRENQLFYPIRARTRITGPFFILIGEKEHDVTKNGPQWKLSFILIGEKEHDGMKNGPQWKLSFILIGGKGT